MEKQKVRAFKLTINPARQNWIFLLHEVRKRLYYYDVAGDI